MGESIQNIEEFISILENKLGNGYHVSFDTHSEINYTLFIDPFFGEEQEHFTIYKNSPFSMKFPASTKLKGKVRKPGIVLKQVLKLSANVELGLDARLNHPVTKKEYGSERRYYTDADFRYDICIF
jgi:hypothetical protein